MFAVLFLVFFFLPLALSDCPESTIKWPYDSPSKCYTFQNILTSFEKAELACNNIGGHLTSIHNGFQNSFLHKQSFLNFTSSTTSDFWIGAIKPENQKNWTWTDHTPFDFSEWQNTDYGKLCGAFLLSNGRWNARDCDQQKPYVCESDEISSQTTPSTRTNIPTTTTTSVAPTTTSLPYCSYPWQYFDNSCYYWGVNSNWQNGETHCAKNNSHLVSIHSANEINFIKSIHNEEFWTGLYSNDNPIDWNSTWQYTDNSIVDYCPWIAPYYPSHNGYKCVSTSGFNFTNVDCSTVLNVFCKKAAINAVLTTPAPLTTPKPTGKCLNGWTYYEKTNSCYFLTYTGNFTTMENYCKMFKGGHLSSFKDADEFSYINTFVLNLLPRTAYYWFGLYSDDGALTWKFTDGTPFNYRPWATGNPIRDGSACASCFDFNQQLINHYSCSQSLVGVCKYSLN